MRPSKLQSNSLISQSPTVWNGSRNNVKETNEKPLITWQETK